MKYIVVILAVLSAFIFNACNCQTSGLIFKPQGEELQLPSSEPGVLSYAAYDQFEFTIESIGPKILLTVVFIFYQYFNGNDVRMAQTETIETDELVVIPSKGFPFVTVQFAGRDVDDVIVDLPTIKIEFSPFPITSIITPRDQTIAAKNLAITRNSISDVTTQLVQ